MKIKRLITIYVLTLLCFLTPVKANEFDDVKENLSLSIHYVNNECLMNDIEFELYYIADMSDHLVLSWSEEFKQFDSIIELNNLDEMKWKEVADTLEAYVIYHNISPIDIKKTNSNGDLSFNQPLKQGIYLVVGSKHYKDGRTYKISPSLLSLPQYNDYSWNGNITLYPKYEDIGEDTSMTIIKHWDDQYNVNKRPVSITVALMKDKQIVDFIVLNKDNNWRVRIEDLEAGYDYKTIEVEVPDGYKVSIEEDNHTYIIKNTYKTNPPKLDQTGVLWWPVPVLAVLGLSFIGIGLYIKKKDDYDEI